VTRYAQQTKPGLELCKFALRAPLLPLLLLALSDGLRSLDDLRKFGRDRLRLRSHYVIDGLGLQTKIA
jgi:hypothetical protein